LAPLCEANAPLESITSTEMVLTNNSAQTIKYTVTNEFCKKPLNDELRPGRYASYTCPFGNFIIIVATKLDTGEVTRRVQLRPTGHFEFYSDEAGVWSVREAEGR
jgi:hypothetical protein